MDYLLCTKLLTLLSLVLSHPNVKVHVVVVNGEEVSTDPEVARMIEEFKGMQSQIKRSGQAMGH